VSDPVVKNVDISDIHQDKPMGGDPIPLQKCEIDGKPAWRWGDSGKPYPYAADDPESETEAKKKALAQATTMGEFDKSMDTERVEKSWEVPFIQTGDRQIVYGVVSEPHTIDLQGDRLSPEEIEKAAHAFMVNSRKVNKGHGGPTAADVLESFIAPGDFTVNGSQVKKGSWVMAVKVNDPDVWQAVKKGFITGFSIGGKGRRVPFA
jgi:hypothetical protein